MAKMTLKEKQNAAAQAIRDKAARRDVAPLTPTNTALQSKLRSMTGVGAPSDIGTMERKPGVQYFPITGNQSLRPPAPIRSLTPVPGLEPPMGPRMSPMQGPSMQPAQPYRSYSPIAPQRAQPTRAMSQPPHANAPQSPMVQLIQVLSRLSEQDSEWTGNGWRQSQWEEEQANRPWLPDLWSLSGR